MKSFTQELEHKQMQAREEWRDFINANKDSYKRYLALFNIIKEEKKRAIETGEQDISTLRSLTSELKGDDDSYDLILQQINISDARLKTSYERLDNLESELHQLEEVILPEKNKLERSFAEINAKKLENKYFTLWKNKARPRLFFEAIDRNNFPALQRLYRPVLANHLHEDGYTPLVHAITKSRLNMIRWLLLQKSHPQRYDVNPNLAVSFGGHKNITPLTAAILWENSEEKHAQGTATTEIMESLLVMNADINKCDQTKKFTALHWAAFTGSKHCIALLLKNGADKTMEDAQSSTPLQLFKKFHKNKPYFKEIESLFLKSTQQDKNSHSRKWFK